MKSSEPVALVTAVEVLVLAVINLAAILLRLDGEVVAALNGVAVSAIMVVGGVLLRLRVTPVKGLAARLEALSDNPT